MSAAPRRAVLLDLDNTLILEDESTFVAIRAAAALIRGVDPEMFATSVAAIADRRWKKAPVVRDAERFGIWWGEALWGDFSGTDPVSRAVRAFAPEFRDAVWRDAATQVNGDEALGPRLGAAYIASRRSAETIDPDAEPMLADLSRDHRLALVTNGAGDVQREKLSRTPFAPHFAAIVVSSEIGVGKPEPAIFQHALAALGAAASDAVMVGDSLERDVAGAHAAGVKAIWIDRKLWKERDTRPDARIERLSDLRAALDVLERRPASPRATL